MDTISRENNSMLPVAGVVVGVIGLLLGGVALVQLSKVKQQVGDHEVKLGTVDSVKATAEAAAADAAKANRDLTARMGEVQNGFNAVSGAIGTLREDVSKIQEAQKKPAPADTKKGKSGGGPVTAGPGEYVVKAGDTFAKIARAQGCSIGDLQAVNPGVDSSKLKLNQKLKLPAKAK